MMSPIDVPSPQSQRRIPTHTLLCLPPYRTRGRTTPRLNTMLPKIGNSPNSNQLQTVTFIPTYTSNATNHLFYLNQYTDGICQAPLFHPLALMVHIIWMKPLATPFLCAVSTAGFQEKRSDNVKLRSYMIALSHYPMRSELLGLRCKP